jgi:hypothetical protein
MADLDPAVAERILGEYPELLDQGRQEMSRPDRDEHYRDSGIRRMHDPHYLRAVVGQYRLLNQQGRGRPDEKLARRCDEIVGSYPPVRDQRTRALTDPWLRARMEPEQIVKLYDPEYLQRWVDARRRSDDPFSEQSLRLQRFVEAAKAGGVITATTTATGEVLDEWEVAPQRSHRPLN